jgi:hypothetical protein
MQPPPTRVGEQAIKNVSSKHIVFGAKPKILLLHGSSTQLWVKIPDRAYVAQCLVSSHSVRRDTEASSFAATCLKMLVNSCFYPAEGPFPGRTSAV